MGPENDFLKEPRKRRSYVSAKPAGTLRARRLCISGFHVTKRGPSPQKGFMVQKPALQSFVTFTMYPKRSVEAKCFFENFSDQPCWPVRLLGRTKRPARATIESRTWVADLLKCPQQVVHRIYWTENDVAFGVRRLDADFTALCGRSALSESAVKPAHSKIVVTQDVVASGVNQPPTKNNAAVPQIDRTDGVSLGAVRAVLKVCP